MANVGHRILDVRTGKQYRSKAAAGRDLAYLVNGDPKDQFVYFEVARRHPDRLRVMNAKGEWVPLDDPSAPVGTLRPEGDRHVQRNVRVTTLAIDGEKAAAVQAALGTSTLRETVERAFDEVLALAARREDIERLRTMRGLDLDKPEVMAKAWR